MTRGGDYLEEESDTADTLKRASFREQSDPRRSNPEEVRRICSRSGPGVHPEVTRGRVCPEEGESSRKGETQGKEIIQARGHSKGEVTPEGLA